MAGIRILISLITVIINANLFSGEISQREPYNSSPGQVSPQNSVTQPSVVVPQKKFKTFQEHRFKIFEPQGWEYKYLNTGFENIKVHRWSNPGKSEIVEIRIGFDLSHLAENNLRYIYQQSALDIFESIKKIKQETIQVNNDFVLKVILKGKLKSGSDSEVTLFAVRTGNKVYFLTVIYGAGKKPSSDAMDIINSFNYY